MAFLWICPLVLSHKPHHIGDGSCGYKVLANSAATFTINGQSQEATKRGGHAGLFVDLGKIAAGSIASIEVKPKGNDADHYWPVSGEILIGKPCVVTSNPMAAFNIVTLGINKDGLSILYVFLSRVRDCTARVTSLLDTLPVARPEDIAARAEESPLWRNPLPSRGQLRYFKTQRPRQSDWDFTAANITPAGENLCFEVAGKGGGGPFVPRILSVYWPQRVRCEVSQEQQDKGKWPAAEAIPFLVYFPASTGQNRKDGYYLGAYPESFDYLYYLFWRNHNYTTAFDDKRGIPYQIDYARASTVSVIPCLNADDSESGHLNEADFFVECLEELHAVMLRRSSKYICRPAVGRVALAGFSAGTQVVANTIGANLRHPFLSENLAEIYMFDPNASSISVLHERLNILSAFLQQGTQEQRNRKMVRYYTQNSSAPARTALASFLGKSASDMTFGNSGVAVLDSDDQHRTAGVFPGSRCPMLDSAGNVNFYDPHDWSFMYHLIPALLLSDALARSGFHLVSP